MNSAGVGTITGSTQNAPGCPFTYTGNGGATQGPEIGDTVAPDMLFFRANVNGGTCNGPVPAPGDSGSPLVIGGLCGNTGVAFTQGTFPDVPTSISCEPLILGVQTGGDNNIPPGVPYPQSCQTINDDAETFASPVSTWLETILDGDFDDDGTPDYSDNCPTVPNGGQQDTNFDAELESARGSTSVAGMITRLPSRVRRSWHQVRGAVPRSAC